MPSWLINDISGIVLGNLPADSKVCENTVNAVKLYVHLLKINRQKNNIKIGSLPYSFPPMISGSQSDALVSENFKCEKNGLTLKNNNQNNVLDALPIEYKIAWKHIYSGYAI